MNGNHTIQNLFREQNQGPQNNAVVNTRILMQCRHEKQSQSLRPRVANFARSMPVSIRVTNCVLQPVMMKTESVSLNILSWQVLIFIFFLQGKFFNLSSNMPPFWLPSAVCKFDQTGEIQTLHVLQTELAEVIWRVRMGSKM